MAKQDFLTSLKPTFMVVFAIAWNTLFGLAIYFNGGMGRITNIQAALILMLTFLGISLLSFGAIRFVALRRLVFRSPVKLTDVRPGLVFFGTLSGFFAVGCLVGAYQLLLKQKG